MRGPLGARQALKGLPLRTSPFLRRGRGPFLPAMAAPGLPGRRLPCLPGCEVGGGAFSVPAPGPARLHQRCLPSGQGGLPSARTRAPRPRRGSDEIWGLLPCPRSTPSLASPSSALTIAPESPARAFLLPVARGQLRRRSRDAEAWPPRMGRGLLRGAGSGRGSRSCHGAKCQRPFSVSPETLPGNDRQQPV